MQGKKAFVYLDRLYFVVSNRSWGIEAIPRIYVSVSFLIGHVCKVFELFSSESEYQRW